jgi:hypothetical protein
LQIKEKKKKKDHNDDDGQKKRTATFGDHGGRREVAFGAIGHARVETGLRGTADVRETTRPSAARRRHGAGTESRRQWRRWKVVRRRGGTTRRGVARRMGGQSGLGR